LSLQAPREGERRVNQQPWSSWLATGSLILRHGFNGCKPVAAAGGAFKIAAFQPKEAAVPTTPPTTPPTLARRPIVIIVRDGWGKNPHPEHDSFNAVKLARHPVADRLMATYPSTLIHTSGFDVGLPEGTMGNSEVGHQNIGAGRIVDQESVKITKEVRNGAFFQNQEMNAACDFVVKNNSSLHLFGIASDAGVHGRLEHLYGCLELAKRRNIQHVFLHAFTDGRDTPPKSGLGFIQQIEAKMSELGVGQIATVSGRYWAMDRDNRWQRVEKAYHAITAGQGPGFESATTAIQHYYDHPTEPNLSGDEFVTPSIITQNGQPITVVKSGDAVIFYNYRGDRPRELTKAFVLDSFDDFNRGPRLDLYYVTMTAYETGLPVHVAYPKPPKMVNTLGQYISDLGLKQFRCAETEKFPHVTFFFNDYREPPFPGEDRQIIQSPKDVSTYDQKPEMSAQGVGDEVVKRIDSGQYDLVVVNFANADMVGHTGVLPAAIKAVEFVDARVGDILAATQRQGGAAIVLADHGNAEQMLDPVTGTPHTSHTTYDVEIIVADDRFKGQALRSAGRLADVAPTALQLMGLPKPPEMTGVSLLVGG
jgi:2,3-bisphosphoglycerate-independent phosphoglycerate mutase